jgi:hypothetical protein
MFKKFSKIYTNVFKRKYLFVDPNLQSMNFIYCDMSISELQELLNCIDITQKITTNYVVYIDKNARTVYPRCSFLFDNTFFYGKAIIAQDIDNNPIILEREYFEENIIFFS